MKSPLTNRINCLPRNNRKTPQQDFNAINTLYRRKDHPNIVNVTQRYQNTTKNKTISTTTIYTFERPAQQHQTSITRTQPSKQHNLMPPQSRLQESRKEYDHPKHPYLLRSNY
jgi:hypothetical protein